MLRFRKVTLENLKSRETSRYLGNFKFQELFVMNFDSKSSWFEVKILFRKRFITKNREGKNAPSTSVK